MTRLHARGPSELDLPAARTPIRTDCPRRMQTAHTHRTRRPQRPRHDVTVLLRAPELDTQRSRGDHIHAIRIPRTGDHA